MKKYLIIAVSLMLLFFNIPVIVSATAGTIQPIITLSETKVKSGDTLKIEIEANNTLSEVANSDGNIILIRSNVNVDQTISLHPKYNENTGKYELIYTIPTSMLNGEWCIEKVVLQDNEGNSTYNYSNITFTVTADSIVNFNSNGGSDIDGLSVEYNGKAVAPPNPTNTGYTFRGWYSDNITFKNPFDFTNTVITENITLFAKWTIDTSTVAFNSQGGSTVTSNTANYNSTIVAPATPTKTGYAFGGWYKEAGCLNAWNFITDKVSKNTILYAKWIIVAPAMPTSLKAASSSYNSINVSWVAVTGAIGYEVYRTTSGTVPYALVSSTKALGYNNTGLTTNRTYYYKVRSYSMVGTTKVYSSFSIGIGSRPIPATPTSVKAVSASYNSIKVSWSAVIGASGYEVYKSTSAAGANTSRYATAAASYNSTGLTTNSTYYYKVRAYRMVGTVKVYGSFSSVISSRPISVARISTVFNNLVQPNAVYGKYAGLKVEILDQIKTSYLIRKANGIKLWIACNKVSVPRNPVTNTKYMDKKQLETYVNITSNFISKTKYFTWVDLNRQRVNVFTGSAGHWVLVKSYSCASGNNITPTKRGFFTVQDKGYSFVTDSKLLVKYWTRFSGNYLLHSILLTASGKIYNATVGIRASHGCVRMPLDMAKWYYDKIPKGSLIWVN